MFLLLTLLSGTLGAPPVDAPLALASSEDRRLNLSTVDTPASGAPARKVDWKLYVDDTAGGELQTVTGFGAAWTDAAVDCFDKLPAAMQAQLLEQLFSSSGINIGLARHTIGQSDLTPSWIGRWSYDENGGKPDMPLAEFNLTDAGRRMVAWLVRMQEANPEVVLLGSPWSPPGWMKSGGGNALQTQYADVWVQYMVKYLTAFKEAGVRVDAMTMQNEPLHSGDGAWTMYMDAGTQGGLASRLGPALAAANLSTELWAYDHNTDHPEYPSSVLASAGQWVNTVAWHCYASGGQDKWKVLRDFHAKHPHVRQYMTECWTHVDSGESFFDLPEFVTGPLQQRASGALAWTIGGSTKYDVAYPGGCAPCSGIVQVDREAGTYELTQDYYTLGQFSKLVAKDALYLNGTGSYTYPDGTGVQATQYTNPADKSRVVVIVNKIKNDLFLEVEFTSGDTWSANVPARAVTTWHLPGTR